MRTFIKILFIAGSLSVAKGADEFVPDNRTIIVPTNIACTLKIDLVHGWDVGSAPVCFVRLTNSSDAILSTLRLPAEMVFRIKLTDANGRVVEKTDYGRQFGRPLTQKEVHDWFRPYRRSNAWLDVPFMPGSEHWGDARWFSIAKAFNITRSGEYTFQLQMRLIQAGISNAKGTIRTNVFNGQYLAPKTEDINFQAIWLPEVTAKIQIRSEHIASTNPVSNGQTNSLPQ